MVPLTDRKNVLEIAKPPKLYSSKELNNVIWLSGSKLIKFLQSVVKTKAQEQLMEYSYFFVNSYNKPMKNIKKCQKNQEQVLILQPGCAYSKKEFLYGYIPFEKEQTLALFYLPLPRHIPEEFSLRALFVYDWHE